MAKHHNHLHWEKVGPGNYAVRVGDARCHDLFLFSTERDAQRFVNASRYSFACQRAR